MINEPSEMYPILVYRNDEVIAIFKHYDDYEKFIDTLEIV